MNKKINLSELDDVFVIAEAGSNWKVGSTNEDIKQAKRLIEIAAESGANAVKFQTFRPEMVYVSNAGVSNYLKESGTSEDIFKILKENVMPYEFLGELNDVCKENNILFLSSAFSVRDAQEVDKFVLMHKVASYEINHVRLLKYLADTQKPIILSTGASNIDEIDFAVNELHKNNCNNIALLQCTSKYPCPISAMNLSAIANLTKKYDLPVGLSDHSVDPILAPVLAIGFGAKIIEKHFTIDKSLPGPDHAFALDPKELQLMVKAIREAEKALGDGEKQVLDEEIELRNFAVRSIQATKDIQKGEILKEGENIDVLRPGNQSRGTEPRFLDNVIGKRASKDIKKGSGIKENFE